MMRAILLAGFLALAAAPASAITSSCGQYDFSGPYSAAFLAGQPFEGATQAAETIRTMADGACHQNLLIERLAGELGAVVGYKAAATSAGAQRQLGLDGPVLGVLFEEMLRPAGSTVSVSDGARLIFELDLLARVGSADINEATTREEALAAIDAFIPFVELGDLMVPKGVVITGPLLQAMNAGARLGIVGEPLPADGLTVDGVGAAAGSLAKDGSVVAEAPATALLGHPLDAVLWIVREANARGWKLEEGDVLSLGSMGPFQAAAPGAISATYVGLSPEPATVSFTLE